MRLFRERAGCLLASATLPLDRISGEIKAFLPRQSVGLIKWSRQC